MLRSESKPRKGFRSTIRETQKSLRNILLSSSPRDQSLALSPNQVGADAGALEAARPPNQSTWAVLDSALQGLCQATAVYPPLKSAISDLLKGIEASTKNRHEYKDLALHLANIVNDLEIHSRNFPLQASSCVLNVVNGIQQEIDAIKHKKKQWGARWYIEAASDTEELLQAYRRIELHFQRLQSNAVLSVWTITNEQLANTRLEGMQPAKQARYDSSMTAVLRRRGCTPNTRKAVLEDLHTWADNPNGSKIYWMNGMAGTGKTTIAYTLCSELERTNQLGASFFCSRELPDCRDSLRIIPTLAYQLARFSSPFQATLCRVLGDGSDVCARQMAVQFTKLLSEPLLQVNDALPPNLVVVIDALDECTSPEIVKQFLDILFEYASTLPVKLFVTCRPEPAIYNTLQRQDELDRRLFHLHDIDSLIVRNDIETYLANELEGVPQQKIVEIAERSGRLFIFAATVVRYVIPNNTATISYHRLNTILKASQTSGTKAYKSIDALYGTILSTALENDDLEPLEAQTMMQVLNSIVCAMEPMTVTALAQFLSIDINVVEHAIEPLRSVLDISEGNKVVSTLHASFPEYILNNERSRKFSCNRSECHLKLAACCFDTMSRLLRFNICNLESSHLLDDDVPDISERIATNIPYHLLYACEYWIDHACQLAVHVKLLPRLSEFLENRILFWLEVMNITKNISKALTKMQILYNLLKSHYALYDDRSSVCPKDCLLCNISDLVEDASRFTAVVTGYHVRHSTPHIYVSVLALWDRKKPMSKVYLPNTQGLTRLARTEAINRRSDLLAAWSTKNPVRFVQASPNGSRMISLCGTSSFNTELSVWNAQTGDELFSLASVQGKPIYATFSPDSRRIASISSSSLIHIWDAQTGDRLVGPLAVQAQIPHVSPEDIVKSRKHSLVFSKDGNRIVLALASGNIGIWDSTNGKPLGSSVFQHHNHITSVVLSSSTTWIATGSISGNTEIYDLHNSNAPVNRFSVPRSNHVDNKSISEADSSGSRSVRAPPDLPWTGSTAICTMALSTDDSLVACGSTNGTICIWETQTRRLKVNLTYTQRSPITCVLFSQDQTLLASTSGGGIYLWDARTGSKHAGPFYGFSVVLSLTFMPDGNRLVSGHLRDTICVWDVRAGHTSRPSGSYRFGTQKSTAFVFQNNHTNGPLEPDHLGPQLRDTRTRCIVSSSDKADYGWVHMSACSRHDGAPISISAGPNRTRNRSLISGIYGLTTDVEDIGSGKPTNADLLTVRSPDHRRTAIAADDFTIWLQDLQTGSAHAGVLRGHTKHIACLVFSHDSKLLVSGSYDRIIRIWDVETEEMTAGPFQVKDYNIYMVALSIALTPNGGTLVPRWPYRSILVWNLDSSDNPPGERIYECKFRNEEQSRDTGWIVGPRSERFLWLMMDSRLEPTNFFGATVFHGFKLAAFNLDEVAIGTWWKDLWVGKTGAAN